MMDLTILQQKITACTGIAFDDLEILVFDEEQKAEHVAQVLAVQAEADEEAFALLTEMAYHIDTSVKILAGMTLERFQVRFDDVAYGLVLRLVRDGEEYVARYGAYALGHFASHLSDAYTYVWELCRSQWWELRYRGASALGMIHEDSTAQKHLVQMMHDLDIIVRRNAADSFSRLVERFPLIGYHVILNNLRALELDSVQTALARLEDSGELTSEHMVTVLTSMSHDRGAEVRKFVSCGLRALVREHPEDVLAVTLRFLSDYEYDVRDRARRCLSALCYAQGTSLFPIVVSLAQDEDKYKREAAARVLGNFHRTHGAKALDLLEQLAKDKESAVRFVPTSLANLRRSFPNQALVILTHLAQHKDEYVRRGVASTARTFVKAYPAQMLDLLARLAKDTQPGVRRQAALSMVYLAKYLPQECLSLMLDLASKKNIEEMARSFGAALEEIVDKQPEEALALFDRFLRARLYSRALAWVTKMGRRREAAALAEGLLQLRWAERKNIAQNLHKSLTIISPLQDRCAYIHEVVVLLTLSEACLKCRSLSDFTLRQGWQTFLALREPFLLAEMIEFGRQLAQARDQAGKYLARTDRREQEMLLVEVLRILERAEAFARQSLYPPYQQLAQLIAAHWRELTRAALESLRGRALLRLRLLSDQHRFGERVDVGLEVHNLGDETAEQVTMQVAACTDYQVVHADPPLEYLSPGAHATWRCVLRLPHVRPTRLAVTVTYRQRGLDAPQQAEFADVLTFFDQAERYPFMPLGKNPYVTGGPLQTEDVFFGRDRLIADLASDLQGMHQDNVIVLYGQRRTGKTSLLYALQRCLPRERYIPVLYDAQGMTSPLSLFWGLANHIRDACTEAGISLPEPARNDYVTEANAQFEQSFLRQVGLILGQRRLLLMIDEFESLEEAVKADRLPQTVFPFFRHLMQHQQKISFIFCGTHQLHELTRHYWQIFFNAALPRRVTFLDEEATLALIQEPVRGHFVYDELALERLLALTGGHPFFTQLLCHSLVRLVGERRLGYVTRNEVDDVAHQLVQTGHDHLDYIWEQSSLTERAVLLALTEETQHQQRAEVLWEQVEARLGEKFPEGLSVVDEARASLDRRELVTSDGPRIRFTIGLIPEWLAAHHTWSSLKQGKKT